MRYLILLVALVCCSCGASNEMGSYDHVAKTAAYEMPQEASKIANTDSEDLDRIDKSRQIVFQADVQLAVPDLVAAERQFRDLVQSFNGYLADVAVENLNESSFRRGCWTARIPVKNFESFLAGIRELGDTTNITQESEDVTMEYVDLQSRIANKQKLEQRMTELLQTKAGNLTDLVKIEKELNRVREGIEVMQGRLRKLADLSSVTTVTVTMTEKEAEPVVVATPSLAFRERVDQAWSESFAAARAIAEDIIVWLAGNLIALLFWMLIGTVFLIVARWWYVRMGRTLPQAG